MHNARVTFDGQPLRPMATVSSFDEPATRVQKCRANCSFCVADCRQTCKKSALCCLATLLLGSALVGFMFGSVIVQTFQIHQDAIAAAMILPTMRRWLDFLDCVREEGCNLCAQPLILKMQPAVATRVAIVGIQGSGATWVRALSEAGSRIMAGSDDCFIMLQWGKPWNLRDAPFKSECAGPFFYSHHSSIRFNHAREWERHPYYSPTHFIFVTRNPFESIISAFHYDKRCGGIATLMCATLSAPLSDFKGPAWPAYVDMRLAEWIEFHALADSTTAPKIIVDYADMQTNTETTMVRVFDFLKTSEHVQDAGVLASTPRMSACAAVDTHNTMTKRPQIIKPQDVFTPELRQKVCDLTRNVWDAARWGTEWCP